MRYISLFIVGLLFILVSCNEAKVTGEQVGVWTAGFRDTVMTEMENAGTGSVTIDFSVPLPSDSRLTVGVVQENNIRENENFLIQTKELTLKAGAQSAEVTFELVDNNIANGPGSFTLGILSVNGGIVEAARKQVRVEVIDDESGAAVGFEHVLEKCMERQSGTDLPRYNYQIPVHLYGTSKKAVQYKVALVPLEGEDAAIEGTHFRLPESTFVIEPGETVAYIPVEIIDDGDVNKDRLFVLEITEVTGAQLYTSRKRCVVTIQNDDLGIYFKKTRIEAEERAGIVKIPVTLTSTTDQPLAFTLACSGSAVEDTDYRLEKNWTIEAGQDSVEIEIELKDLPGITPDRTLELQFAQVTEGVQIFDVGRSCELTILDCNSMLRFEQTDMMILNDSTKLVLPLLLSEPVGHDVTFQVNIASREGLSEGQVSVVNPEISIPAGSVSAQVEIALKKLSLKNKADFSLEIAGIYGASSGSVCRVSKYYKYQTTDLEIADFTSEEVSGEGAGNGCAVNAIDGKTDKYWHSIWNGANPVLPEGIVITLPDHLHVMAVDVIRRVAAQNSDLRQMKLYLSETNSTFLRDDDGSVWGEALGTLEWPKEQSTEVGLNIRRLSLKTATQGKYLKLSCTQSWRASNAQIAEVIVYGYTE